MHPFGVLQVERAKADGRWDAAYAGSAEIDVPRRPRALATNPAARRCSIAHRQNRYAILYRIPQRSAPRHGPDGSPRSSRCCAGRNAPTAVVAAITTRPRHGPSGERCQSYRRVHQHGVLLLPPRPAGLRHPAQRTARAALDLHGPVRGQPFARARHLPETAKTPTGSVHIVNLQDAAAARAFAFEEPNYQAGVYRDVLLRRWRNELGGTMWDFHGGPTDGNRYLVLGLGSGQAADPNVRSTVTS